MPGIHLVAERQLTGRRVMPGSEMIQSSLRDAVALLLFLRDNRKLATSSVCRVTCRSFRADSLKKVQAWCCQHRKSLVCGRSTQRLCSCLLARVATLLKTAFRKHSCDWLPLNRILRNRWRGWHELFEMKRSVSIDETIAGVTGNGLSPGSEFHGFRTTIRFRRAKLGPPRTSSKKV